MTVLCHTVYDIEATGKDPVVAEPIMVAAQECVDGEWREHVWGPDEIPAAVAFLNEPHRLRAGHNIEGYDEVVLRRYGLNRADTLDTRAMCRQLFPEKAKLKKRDWDFADRNPEFPRGEAGQHTLRAWLYRIGADVKKQDYDWNAPGAFTYNERMRDYCRDDVGGNVELLQWLLPQIPLHVALLESRVHRILTEQRLEGAPFDTKAAGEWAAELVDRQDELVRLLRGHYRGWWARGEVVTPKRTQQSRKIKPGEPGYKNVMEGCPFQKITWTEFEPTKDAHIRYVLERDHKWRVPRGKKYRTDGGDVSVKEEILQDLPFEPMPLLVEHKQIQKLLGFLTSGKESWLRHEKNGRIHGTCHATGTYTQRGAHTSPNLGNVPTRSELASGCRKLFRAPPGKVYVGADADGLQLRALAHWLCPFDGGAFARVFIDAAERGEKADPHTYMMAGTGILNRDVQKTWTYARLLNAGPPKLGSIIIHDRVLARERGMDVEVPALKEAKRLGEESFERLNDYMDLSGIEKKLDEVAKRGWMRGLDGRKVPVPSRHVALATRLQESEAVIMKTAMVLADNTMRSDAELHVNGRQVLWVHDEFQYIATRGWGDRVGSVLTNAIVRAGVKLGLRVPLASTHMVGETWHDTH